MKETLLPQKCETTESVQDSDQPTFYVYHVVNLMMTIRFVFQM